MKILILVLSYDDNNIYSDFYKSQINTWDSINVEGVNTFYLFGNHINDEIIDNKILVNVQETSTHICGHKTLKAFELINNLEFDYIFRTNSSSYVDKDLLLKFVNDKPKNNYYSGVIGNYENIPYASGSGYFLSRDLFDLVIENINLWEHHLIDDIALGQLLGRFNVYPQPNQRFNIIDNDNINNINIPNNYYHYRLKTYDRESDISNMYNIFKLKQ